MVSVYEHWHTFWCTLIDFLIWILDLLFSQIAKNTVVKSDIHRHSHKYLKFDFLGQKDFNGPPYWYIFMPPILAIKNVDAPPTCALVHNQLWLTPYYIYREKGKLWGHYSGILPGYPNLSCQVHKWCKKSYYAEKTAHNRSPLKG